MTVVSPVLSVLSPTPNESIKNAIMAMTPKAEKSEIVSKLINDKDGKEIKAMAEMFKVKEIPTVKAGFTSSVIPYDVYESSGAKTIEPKAYKNAKFMKMFESMTPPKTEVTDAPPKAAKGLWNSIKKHPFVSTVVALAAVGGGIWACTRDKEEKPDELQEAA